MKILITLAFLLFSITSFCQSKKVELFDLVKMFVQDSTGYNSVGDWAVGRPSKYPVQWQADRIVMSEDLKINFYRKGTANISINGTTLKTLNKPMKWDVMLKGPRAGYMSFTIHSGSHKDLNAKTSIDSLFGKKPFTYKLLEDCSSNTLSGFYYYQVKIINKVDTWIKISWNCSSGNCSITLDGYDGWGKQDADLTCPK